MNQFVTEIFVSSQGGMSLLGDFGKGWKFVGLAEGGFVNHPNDRGKATNFGITMATLSRWRQGPVSVAEVKALTVGEAAKIIKAYYWDPAGLDGVKNDALATAFFDQLVNRGLGFIKDIQRIAGVSADGEIGAKTIAAINAKDPKKLIDAVADNAKAKYLAIVKARPSQKVFLKGWLARAEHVRGLKKFA